LSAEGFDEDFPSQVKEEVYWMIQTAIGNSRDHAQAHNLSITLRRDAERLYACVRDDGVGFDPGAANSPPPEGHTCSTAERSASRRHLGLRNMRGRAARLGADLTIDTGPAGTEVRIDVPLAIMIP
jgi:two-component system sensor histidine kinase UhpB